MYVDAAGRTWVDSEQELYKLRVHTTVIVRNQVRQRLVRDGKTQWFTPGETEGVDTADLVQHLPIVILEGQLL